MTFPSQSELLSAIQQLKSYVDISDDNWSLVNTAALIVNTSRVTDSITRINSETLYPGEIPQTIYLDAANNYIPVLYTRKYDVATSQYNITVITLTADTYVPINPPDYIVPGSPLSPTTDSYGLIQAKYEATVTTGEFTIKDQLSKITPFVNSLPLTAIWVNDTTGLLLTTAPSLPSQAKPSSDYIELLVEALKLTIDNILVSSNQIKLNTDITVSDLTEIINGINLVVTVLNSLSIDNIATNSKLDTLITGNNLLHTDNLSVNSRLQDLTDILQSLNTVLDSVNDIKTLVTAYNSTLNAISLNTSDIKALDTLISDSINRIETLLNTFSIKFKFKAGTSALITDSSDSVQPISAVTLPLPIGAATEVTSASIKYNTDNLDVPLSSVTSLLAKESGGNLYNISTKLSTLETTASGLKVDGSSVTQPVSIAINPLPNNASTLSKQDESIVLETNINNILNTVNSKLNVTIDGLKVDGSNVTQPVSINSLPLPTGATTEATLQDVKVELINLNSKDFSTASKQDITNTRVQTISDALSNLANLPNQIDTNTKLDSIDSKLNSQAISSKQDTTNTLLTTINSKDFATEASLAAIKDAVLGNVNISESTWTDDSGIFFIRKVSFNQDTNLEQTKFFLFDNVTEYFPATNPKPADRTLNIVQPLTNTELRSNAVSVTGDFYPLIQSINATSLPLPAGASTVSEQINANNLLQSIDNNSFSLERALVGDVQISLDALNSKAANIVLNTSGIFSETTLLADIKSTLTNVDASTTSISNASLNISSKLPSNLTTNNTRLLVDGSGVIQPISGTVNTGLIQPLTDDQLRASAVNVVGDFYPVTQPISATSLPLPTGAATNSSLIDINNSVLLNKQSTDALLSPIGSINYNLDGIFTVESAINNKLPNNLTVSNNKLLVDNSGVIQPISGTVSISNLTSSLTDSELRAFPLNVVITPEISNVESTLLPINSIASINITSKGSGYVNGASVTFIGGTATTPSVAEAVVVTGGVVGIRFINNGQYTVNPTGFTIAGGAGCTGNITMGSVVTIETSNVPTVRGFISSESIDSVAFEVTTDGFNWSSTEVINTSTNSTLNIANASNYPLHFVTNVSGTQIFRVRRLSLNDSNSPRVSLVTSEDIACVKTQPVSSSTTGLTDAQLRANPINTTVTNLPSTGLFGIQSSPIGILNTLPMARYKAGSAYALTDGQVAELQVNSNGALRVKGINVARFDGTSLALEASLSAAQYNASSPTATVSGNQLALQCDINGNLKTILSGSLPAFSSTPTFNIGTAPTITVSGSLGRTWNLNSTTDAIAIGQMLPSGTNSIGEVTANIGVTNGLALDITQTNGNQVSQVKSGIKGTSTSELITSTSSGANHQPLDVILYDALGNSITNFASSTLQIDGNTTITQIDSKIPLLGQGTPSNSIPVVLPVSQISELKSINKRNTYSCAFNNITTAAAATDVLTISGATGRLIYITYISVSGSTSTNATVNLSLIKRNTLNIGGTSTLGTVYNYNPASPISLATVRSYTVNPTLGNQVALIRSRKMFVSTVTTVVDKVIEFDFTKSDYLSLPQLSTVNDLIAVHFNFTSVATPSFNYTIEWIEEAI